MNGQTFASKYGSWAFIAGASEGIGAAYAHQLAELGLNVYLVARRKQQLEQTAASVRQRFSVQVETQSLDLASPDLLGQLEKLDGRDFGLCVYNAAYAEILPFLKQSTGQLSGTLDVNCRGSLLLAHHFAGRFRERGRGGGIILMTSLLGFSGVSLLGTYAATKSFLVTLGESLYYELGPEGIDVLACVAGATKTPSYLGSQPQYAWWFKPPEAEPDAVVAEALAALGRKPIHVTGPRNRMMLFFLQRVLGRALATRVINDTISRTYRHKA